MKRTSVIFCTIGLILLTTWATLSLAQTNTVAEPEAPIRIRQLRDYQLELTATNKVLLWDGYRLVKVLTISDDCALNKALEEDND